MPKEQEYKSYRVLVVEDEGLIAHDIAKRLETLGHHVVGTASTADEALDAARDAELVLMDIRIDGDRDGIQAAAEIRERYHLPVIFLTAHADRSTLERAKHSAPYGYIVKPLGPAILQAAIEMAIYKHAVERQLEEREAWLRTTVASTGEAILAADRAGNICLMNAAAEALTGVSFAHAEGRPLREILQLSDSASGEAVHELDSLAIVRDTSGPLEGNLEIVAASGHRRAVEGIVAPVRTSTGTAGVVVSLFDVSTRRWQELRARQAQRMEAAGRLAASVAADYAHLVAAIRKQAGQLLAQFGEYSPARQALEGIHQAASQADHLTRRLETLASRPPSRTDLISLNALLRRLTRLVESVAGRGRKVHIQQSPGLPRIVADEAQLEQAVMSLVMHAASVTPEEGSLRIETRAEDAGHVALTLTYSGMEDDPERLFDPVRQGSDDNLGLALALSIVADQGGVLIAQAIHDGTRIRMLWPSAQESHKPESMHLAIPSVVLIEPRERVRAYLHNTAEAAGYNLLEATSWEEAAALCEVQDRAIDILAARSEDVDHTLAALESSHQPLRVLRFVDGGAQSEEELESAFSEQAFLARLADLVPKARSAAS